MAPSKVGISSSKAESPSSLYRPAPYNIEAEQALLSCLLRNNQNYEKISESLQPKHFSQDINGKIYHAVAYLLDHGKVADPITLKKYLETEKILQETGGVAYLTELATLSISIVNIEHYAQHVVDLYLRRQLIALGEDVVNNAHAHQLEIEALQQIEVAEQKLFELATTGESSASFVPFHTILQTAIETAETAYKRDSQIVGCTTGFKDLDKWLGGLHPSDLIIIAGRPSMGKTALATNMAFSSALAYHMQKQGARTAFFSLEMSAEQLATRILAQESGISSDKIRRGELSHKDFPKFVEVSRRISQIPLFIDDTPALTTSGLRTRARRLKRQHGLDLIIIDYLQLIHGHKNSDNRVQEISDITRSLKALAKELNVPVIALSQLSRAVEQRDDKRPHLADLRESGSIEQDADVVMFVYREEYYESRKEPAPDSDKYVAWRDKMEKIYNQADVIIAKQRHGPIGTIKLFFDGKLTKFANLTHD